MKYKNIYRTDTVRLQGYDYSQNGAYFVTVCSDKRQNYFGEIKNDSVELTEIGEIISVCWFDISNHFPFVKLGEFVVMPNHIHGVIIIERDYVEAQNVETQNLVSLRQQQEGNKFGPQSKNLASIVRGFKIGVTKFARQNTEIYTVWQKGYYEHIIRSENDYNKIAQYILENPMNWTEDSLNN